ncbi:hypothetical protein [Lactococcus garvieae]|uniref:Uncharacterized protein n=1 Tax=Lactococcus garvieae TaxID=1363 RepID=A0AA46TV90_9LACT|nr:hypothetical protein [Lactococcus garvieae]UYT10237.1 hypothetical protein OF801_09820 [Lactococcus garvieae]UYT12267.1 hypothetical protein OF800_09770 [Lactococcus garvieae]
MSNSIANFVAKPTFFGKKILIGETSPATLRGGVKAKKYPVMTEKVAMLEVFVTNPRKAEEANIMDLINTGRITVVPRVEEVRENGRVSNTYIGLTYLADSASNGKEARMDDFKKADDQLAKLNTSNGDVTEFMDFEETFGDLVFLNATTDYFRDPLTNQATSDVTGYVVTARSEKTNEVYTIDVLNVNSEVSSFAPLTKIKFKTPTARLFRDTSQAENVRVSISLSAEDMEKVSVTAKPQETAPKPQNQDSNKQKPNNENK